MRDSDVLIVGAGPSGVASALALKDVGVRSLVLNRAQQVAAAWRARHDRLRLDTARPLSHRPGRRSAKGTSMFPTRDELSARMPTASPMRSRASGAGPGSATCRRTVCPCRTKG